MKRRFSAGFDLDRDHYAILGVSPDADPEGVRKAFRGLVRRYHPDSGPRADPRRFDDAVRAYDVLRDPDKRRFYDAYRQRSGAAAPPEPIEADIEARIRRLTRRALARRGFREQSLTELMRIETETGRSTLAERRSVLDHWVEELQAGTITDPDLREMALEELASLEKVYEADVSAARAAILSAWAEELKRRILDDVGNDPSLLQRLVRIERDYGYDTVRERREIAGRHSDKAGEFARILKQKLRRRDWEPEGK